MSAAKNTVRIQRMCVAALLCAIAILIPMISPVKIQLGPMSFTLGSHVAIFIAMFILLSDSGYYSGRYCQCHL